MPRAADEDSFIGQVALTCGLAVAYKIIEAHGGVHVYFARSPAEDQQIVKLIGVGMARKIAREIGAGKVWIPQRENALSAVARTARREQLRVLLAEGLSQRRCARRMQCGIRTVERDIAWLRARGQAS